MNFITQQSFVETFCRPMFARLDVLFVCLVFLPAFSVLQNPAFTSQPQNPSSAREGAQLILRWSYNLQGQSIGSASITNVTNGINGAPAVAGKSGANSAVVLPGYRHLFSVDISDSQATLTFLALQRSDNGSKYLLQITTGSFFTLNSDVVNIGVLVPPSITYISANQTVTEGQNVKLTCTPGGYPAANIIWTRLSDNSTVTMPLINIRRQYEGGYRCTADNGIGSPATRVTYIIVHYKPENVTLNANVSSNKVCAPKMVKFKCNAGAAEPEVDNYTLYQNDTVIANRRGSGVFTLWLNTIGHFIYLCEANNSEGTGTSNNITFAVEVSVQISTNLITGSNTLRRGQDVALYCNASGFPEPTITWSKVLFNTVVEVTLSKWLNFTNIKEDKSGMYICQANNTCGKRNPSVITIKVLHKPENVTLNANALSGKVCAAKMVKFTCKAGAAEPEVDHYALYQNDTVIANMSGSGVFTLWLNTSGHFIYLCEAKNSEGTGTSNNITFAVEVSVQISTNLITGSNTLRRGQDVALYCNASGFPEPTITWSKVLFNTVVEVTLSKWLNFTNIKEDKSGMYICQANNTCGKRNSSVITIKVLHAPENVMLTEDSLSGKVCAGNVVHFMCKAGAANPEVEHYTLYRNNTVIANMKSSGVSTLWLNTSGLYIFKCKAKNSVGVGTSNSIAFPVEVPPSIKSVSPRTVTKEGEDVTLFCNVTGDPAPNVVWVDARNHATNSGATLKLPKISRRLKGEYICVASNTCGSGSKTTTIDVQYPSSATDTGQNKTVRTGSSETLSCPVDGNPQPSITWYKEKDSEGIVLSIGKELKFVDANSGDTGCYTCSASNGLGKPINITQCLTFETSKVSWTIILIITNKDCRHFPEEEFRMEVAKLLEHLGLNSIEIKTRCGSVIVDLGLGFNQSVDVNDVISTLKDAASDGKFGDFNVDSNSIRQPPLIATSSPSPTNTEGCNCSCNTVLWVIIGILVAIIIVLIIIIVWQNKKGTTKRPYEVPPHDAGFYDNGIAMEEISPTHVSPSSSTQKLSMSGPGYMDLQEVTRSDKYRTDQSRPTTSQQQNPSQPAEYAPLNLRTRSWDVARDNVTVDKIIGKGAFGQVAKGTAIQLPFSNGKTTVAVKMLKPNAPEADKKDLLSELELMKTLKPHPHIIKLMGCVTLSEPLLVLIEYVPYGDLLGYLRKSRGLNDTYYKDPDVKPRTSLTSQQLMKFAWQIADGMSYLSSRKIIHRDLAARNVLVGERETCKVTDFGMARDVRQEDIYEKKTRGRLPVKWTAYESLLYGTYTTKSDIWSYGVVLYEIFTIGGSPYPRMDGKRIANALQHGYRMPKPQHVDDALYQIMTNCWQKEPEARPSFPALTKQLKEMEKQHQRLINMHIYDNELYGNLEDLNV